MKVTKWIQSHLIFVAVFVTGVAVGMLCAPPTEKVADADRDCERLQKSYWQALRWKEQRENELIDMSLKTGIPWGKPEEESHE
jgi:hypothetical protein